MAAGDSEIIDKIIAQQRARNAALPPAVPVPYTPGVAEGPQVPPQQLPMPEQNPILAALSNLGQGAVRALETPQGLVHKGLGDIGALFRGGPGGQEGFRNWRDEVAALAENPQFSTAFGGPLVQALNLIPGNQNLGGKLAGTAFKVGTEVGLDPLTYVGGIGALKNAAIARQASPGTIRFLTALSRGEDVIQSGLNLPFQAISQVPKVLKAVPAFGRTVIDQPTQTAREATSLYDFLASKSRESTLKGIGRKLIDVYKYLNNLGVDIGELSQTSRRRLPEYVDPLGAEKAVIGIEQGIVKQVENLPDPDTQVAALDTIAHGHKVVADFWATLTKQYHDAQSSGMASADLANLALELDQQAYRSALNVWGAVNDTIVSFARRAPQPTISQPIGPQVKMGLDLIDNEMQKFYQNFGKIGGIGTSLMPFTAARTAVAEKIGTDIGALTSGIRAKGYGRGYSPDQAVRDMQMRFEALQKSTTRHPSFLEYLPDELRAGLETQIPEFMAGYRRVVSARSSVEKALQTLWTNKGPQGVPFPGIDPARPFDSVNSILRQSGITHDVVNNTHELVTKMPLFGQVPARQINRIRDSVNQFPSGDLLTTDPFELVLDTTIRQTGGALGIRDQQGIGRLLGDLTALYREQALASANYPLQNLASGLIMGTMRGVNPIRVTRRLGENLGAAARGEVVHTDVARNFQQVYGQDLGEAVRQSSGLLETNATRQFTRKGITASQRFGSVKLGIAGGVAGGLAGGITSPSDATGQERAWNIARGAAEGGLAGAAMPKISELVLRRFGGAIETVMRESAAAQGAVTYMDTTGPQLVNIAERALNFATPKVARTPATKGSVLSLTMQGPLPGNKATALQEIRNRAANHSAISPEELFTVLEHAGVDAGRANDARQAWANVVQQGVTEGQKFSNAIHFDYADLTNIEQFLRTVVPFSTWMVKAVPFFAEEMAKHPVILQSLLAINEESQRQIKERGLTQRFAGSLPVDWATPIWSAIIGHQATPWVDPTRGLMPFSGAARQFGAGTEEDPLLAQLLTKAGAFGPSIHPLGESLLRATGQLGPNEPARGYITHAPRLAAVDALLGGNRGRGIDINAPMQEAENLVRRAGGQDPTNIRISMAGRRLDEMALRDTGQNIRSGSPDVAPYVQAKVRQSGPLWDQAFRDVQREAGARSLGGYVFAAAAPAASLGAEEAAIRGAGLNRLVSPELSNTVRVMSERTPDGLVPPQILDQVRAAAQTVSDRYSGGVIPPQVDMVLTGAPTARNVSRILSQITEAQALRENPAIQGYSGGGPPQEQKLNALLAEYNNPGAILSGFPAGQRESISHIAALYSVPGMAAQRPSGVPAQLMQQAQQAKDAFRKANPMLDQYLNYQVMMKGKGTPEDFFANWFNKQGIPVDNTSRP